MVHIREELLMAASVQIHATAGNGATLKQFAEILQKRMQYMNETARDSIAACALQVLRSLRTVTRVAKPKGIKPELKAENQLYPSWTTKSGKKGVCLRIKGSNQKYAGTEKMIFAQQPTRGMDKLWKVWSFVDPYSKSQKKYMLAAPNLTIAKQKAKAVISRYAMRFAGLAKCALSMLMMKTYTGKKENDNVPAHVTAKAMQTTRKSESVSKNQQAEGGTYSLTLTDELKYAVDAIRGGKAQVDTQMKKAMNKIVSTINHKIPDSNTFFSPQKLETPFPELVRKRK